MTTLLSLNVWRGKCFDQLISYIGKRSGETDVFCFQEVLSAAGKRNWEDADKRVNLFSEISDVLSGFTGFFAPACDWYDTINTKRSYHFSSGLALFTRKAIRVVHSGDIFVFGERSHSIKYTYDKPRPNAPCNLQYAVIEDWDGKEAMIANLHGIWTGQSKTDTPERIEQSQSIIDFLDRARTFPDRKMRKILCGDFNLRPETESLRMLEQQDKGMKNLIKEHAVATTRSSYYDKRECEPYADYMLVSPDINVLNFVVDTAEVSDHLPLILHYQ